MNFAYTRRAALRLSFTSLVIACLLGMAALLAAPRAYAALPTSSAPSDAALMAAQADELSADVESETAEPDYTQASVQARAYVQGKGWADWVASGKSAGSFGSLGLRAIKLKLDGLSENFGGAIKYRTYDKGKGWGAVHAGASSSGRASVPVQAVRIWLTGDVKKHYDVLYRLYVKGAGWQPWSKNKAKNGKTGSGYYATAIQVKLSPKTELAVGKKETTVGVRYELRLGETGWLDWKGDGKKAGVTGSKSKGAFVDGFVTNLAQGSLSGSIKYRAYIQGKKWKQGWKSNGSVAGVKGKRIEALQIKLTGALAKKYDVYYRSYVRGYGWLDWTCNKGTSGSTGLNLPIAAVKVKLVKKGTVWTSATAEPTVNDKIKTLNGIDISGWQAGINIAKVPADFVIVKATGGKSFTNKYYRAMANATLKSGKLLGLYHFACDAGYAGTAIQEADHFIEAARPYLGKAVLVLDWEGPALPLKPKWAKAFLDRVYDKTGVRPLIYMSKSYTRSYNWKSVAKNYKLWVAQYAFAYQNGTGYVSNPWTDSNGYGAWKAPTIFQYSSAGRLSGYNGDLDLDIFYGKPDAWKALAAKS